MLHAILVDGMIERIEGSSEFADAEIGRRREQGYTAAYLFAAVSEDDYERKRKVRLGRCCDTRALLADEETIMNNILVGNLSRSVTEQNIRPLFEKHGAVKRFKLMTDHFTGLSRGFGFIEMKTDASAAEAILALNGTDLNGKVLKVSIARPQLHRIVGGKSKR